MRFSIRLLRPFMGQISKQVDLYSEFHPSALSIQQYIDFGRNGSQLNSFLFLRKELLVRLANIMKEISLLPKDLLDQSSAVDVRKWYQESFIDLLKYELTEANDQTLHEFNDVLQKVLQRHSYVVETLAEALLDLKRNYGIDVASERNLQYFLDRFYMNRISIRMLMNQHLLLFGSNLPESPLHIGNIDPACDVVAVVQDAYENARFLCDRYYLAAPSLKLEEKNAVENNVPITLNYVPSHLYHIVFELFKNSMRAVVEFHNADDDLPDLKVFVVKGQEDLSIKICDRGGGVNRNKVDLLFNYLYSTAPPPARDMENAPLAGYGYGLPLSRLYARYFQGDMFLVSMEGYGTDACIYLKALAPEASELLPIYSTSSIKQLTQSTKANDWTPQTHAPQGRAGSNTLGPGYDNQARAYSTRATGPNQHTTQGLNDLSSTCCSYYHLYRKRNIH